MELNKLLYASNNAKIVSFHEEEWDKLKWIDLN